MCQYFVFLSRVDQDRFFACCEHGFIHLQWWKVRFTFTFDEFTYLLDVLEAKQYSLSINASNDSNGPHSLIEPTYKLNIGPVVLKISAGELTLLLDAMYEALSRLEEEGNPAQQMLHKRRTLTFPAEPSHLFSSN